MLFGFTLILYCKVGGNQGWDLSSDVGAEDLPPFFYLVILNDLGLEQESIVMYSTV